MTGPARITIELEPPTRTRERWVARTRIEEPASARPDPPIQVGIDEPLARDVPEPTTAAQTARQVQPMEPLPSPEQREPAVVPAGYEPPEDCTCLDGFCEADHANE